MKTINKLIKELTLVNFLFKIKTVLRKFSNTVEDEFEKVDDRIFIVEERVTVNEGDISNIKDKNLEQDNKIIAIEDNITDINEGIRDLDSRVEILEDKIAVVYTPKGSVANIDALFALTNQQIGWVYNLSDTGMNYVYLGGTDGDQGNGWDSLGGWVDFSEYYTRLEVDAKLDAIDLQEVTDLGNMTTNDINIISENGQRLAILDPDDVILSDLVSGKNTTLSNVGGNSILEHTDNGITNGLSINKDRTVFTKVVQGVDAEDNLDFTTLQQVTDLIEQGGGGVEVGFGLSKEDDGTIRLGQPMMNQDQKVAEEIKVGELPLIIGDVDLSIGVIKGITFEASTIRLEQESLSLKSENLTISIKDMFQPFIRSLENHDVKIGTLLFDGFEDVYKGSKDVDSRVPSMRNVKGIYSATNVPTDLTFQSLEDAFGYDSKNNLHNWGFVGGSSCGTAFKDDENTWWVDAVVNGEFIKGYVVK